MEIINTSSKKFEDPSVVTIGTFDGVHIGHQKIIEKLVDSAKSNHLKSIALTFFPHPRMVLQKDAKIKLINTINERAQLMEGLGLDYLYIKKFDLDFSRLTAEEFVSQVLVAELHAKKVIIGYDHHFGRNRNANIEDLKVFGEEFGFEVEEISAQDIDEVAVSSTKIRNALKEGDVQTANTYLGYEFMLTGEVVKGKGLGKDLQYPTANIQIPEAYKLIPKIGSYVVKSTIEGQTYFGMMNIGLNPTVKDDEKESIEVHFFKLNQDLYNKTLTIHFLTRIRDEEKFDGLDDLVQQLDKDKAFSLDFIKTYDQ
ncbi:bifunctional riboflavin kinase/FAD synthetase [Mangrovimonas futianensis]|uniref:bifunctional riboflavin kinase/FAD synthetase n=1 Tax=Mangrovimonas futianensis TaxID=2895523 RepID=UPI001E3373C1|nr:bifunctional riboflavin kinase/FAD synthetase [Mangrovimonas futianensis]MCF1421768.1 bifunctional riboflavin kinase/FAD synthetase [Mangrovimonas futianensis]